MSDIVAQEKSLSESEARSLRSHQDFHDAWLLVTTAKFYLLPEDHPNRAHLLQRMAGYAGEVQHQRNRELLQLLVTEGVSADPQIKAMKDRILAVAGAEIKASREIQFKVSQRRRELIEKARRQRDAKAGAK